MTFSESDQWKFVVVTHDGRFVNLYVDGKLIERKEFEYSQASVDADLIIGADNLSGDPLRFTGEIDELMIFDRVIDETQVREMFESRMSEVK